VVGSANFPESTLLGDVYAEALKAAGFAVYRECYLPSREVYYRAMLSGQITVVPEYNGTLLTTTVDPNSKAVSTQAIDTVLTTKLPHVLAILNPSRAQDMDSVTVTRATAAKYHLVSIADLRSVAKNLVIGGPPEFQNRGQGLVGLRRKYGLTFSKFEGLDDSGPITIAGLATGEVQAADVFTTTAVPAADHFVRLTDPRHVFTTDNIVPLIYKSKVNASARRTLNAVSAKLTTADLMELNAQVASGQNPVTVAIAWLQRVGLG
jgi:osmoprotectant transport system substrate-binding protein